MIIKHRGIAPQIDPSAYVAPTATVVGNVSIAAGTKVLFGAVINSEGSRIRIGRGAIVSENAVIRATAEGNKDHPVELGKAIMSVDFARTAFNIDVSGKARVEIYKETTLVRSKEYEAHFEDQIIKEK
jgi:UDP-3-O-[3-hydroxymyristoyl] glucosamine N-acyltransferase